MAHVADGIPVRAASYLSAPKLFSLALIVATIIPFFSGGIGWATGKTPYFPLQATITFLATIHVPLTVYLLFDPRIRETMRQKPVGLILVPIAIFAACILVFVVTAKGKEDGTASFLVYFSIFVMSWNLWHFGKQNIGVYSFFRSAQNQSGMLAIEKKLILVGSTLGVLTTFAIVGDYYIKQFASKENFDLLTYVYGIITPIGKVGQFALLAGVAYYVIFNWARFNWQTALMFAFCTNYFLPQYLVADASAGSFIFACNTASHGLQYVVFLGFHAVGPDGEHGAAKSEKNIRPLMLLAFAATFLCVAYFWFSSGFLSASWLGNSLGRITGDARTFGTPMTNAIVTGILLNHFWLDSYFWRFRDSASRNWMLARYAFLFRNRKMSAPVAATVGTTPMPATIDP
jgi:hypothetical protein